MTVFYVEGPDGEKTLVNAKTRSKLNDFLVKTTFKIEVVTTSEMADLIKQGVPLIDAIDETDIVDNDSAEETVESGEGQ